MNLFQNKLDENSFNVNFNLDLFNSTDIDYYETNEVGQRVRFVPTMINDIVGEYLNIPNANSTSNETSLLFDIFVDYSSEYEDRITDELEYVGYNNTLNAIEEFKSKLLAQYFPLGTPYLYMGGEDSRMEITTNEAIDVEEMELKIKFKNTDEENIMFLSGTNFVLKKDADNLIAEFDTGLGETAQIPYNINEDIIITINKNDSGFWQISDGTNTYTSLFSSGINSIDNIRIANSTGLEAIIKSIRISSALSDNVNIIEWNSKDSITNSGETTLDEGGSLITNCILWSEDGNAIFGFGTLSPTTDIRVLDGRYVYQGFELPISVFISNDVLFGNNFEYYLDGEQIYPIDRQHSVATEIGSAQYINQNENEHIVEETSREHTLSFYYIPSKKLNSLLKHIVSGTTSQNTTYTLLVQYPFFQVSYDVLLDTGGTQPNINTISTFTLTFKKSDSNL